MRIFDLIYDQDLFGWEIEEPRPLLPIHNQEQPPPPTPMRKEPPAGWTSLPREGEAPAALSSVRGWVPHTLADLGLDPFGGER